MSLMPGEAGLIVLSAVLLVAAMFLAVRLRASRTRAEALDRTAHEASLEASAARTETAAARREIGTARTEIAAALRTRDDAALVASVAREIAVGDAPASQVAARIAAALHEAWDAACIVRLLSDDGATVIAAAAEGAPLPPPAPSHAGLVGYVLHRRRPARFFGPPPSDLPLTPEERAFLETAGVQAVAMVPLHRGGSVLGTLEVHRKDADETAFAEDVLATVGDIAAGALEAARQRDVLRAQIDELRGCAEELRQADAALREDIKSRDDFMATVAHELRTPLNAIIGWGHVLRSGTGDESTRLRALESMIRNADQQSRLISDLMDLSRVTAGTLRLELQPVELAPVVRAALDTVRPSAETKGLRLRSSIDADAGPLRADPHRLQQIVWNLLVNAVKFTPADGEVRVEAERHGDDVELRVSDTGPGIPEEFLPQVFEAFRQAPGGAARVHGGLGLGLAIVRQLVELHGGQVTVRNNAPEPGTTFVVRLPLRAPAPQAVEDERPDVDAHDLPMLEGLRVLVVDDEMEDRELIASVLRDRGADLTAASSVAEALPLIRSGCPELIVSDVDLGGEDGYALVRKLRALPASEGGAAVAVALSTQSGSEERVRALLAGYQGQLNKPVRPAELVALVATLTDRVRSSALAS